MKLKPLIDDLKLDYINKNITDENFPYGEFQDGGDVTLFHPNRYMSSNDVTAAMENEGLRPATLHEMLIWAAENWNGEDWVIALGSVASLDGEQHVAFLDRFDTERGLYLVWRDYVWSGFCRFAAVRKSQSSETHTIKPSYPLNHQRNDKRDM